MTINCTIASNVPEWLDNIKEELENLLGVKFQEVNNSGKCDEKKCCCHNKEKSLFDGVEQIEHII